MSDKEKALRDSIFSTYAEARVKFEKFTKANEIIENVKEVFDKELSDSLYKCFIMGLCAFPNLTEDELIEKVLNDIKQK